MRIAVVSHIYPTRKRPAQATFIKNEAQLIARKHDVDIYLPTVYALPFQLQFQRTREPDEHKLTVHRFHYLSFPRNKFSAITRFTLSKRLDRMLYGQPPDIVHLHWLYPSGLAAPRLKKSGYPVVITIHGGDWNRNLDNSTLEKLKRESVLAADKLVCVGKRLKNDIVAEYPELKDKICHISHGVDTDLFKPPDNKKQIKQQIKWSDKTVNLLCIANLYHEKGVDILIPAFASLQKLKDFHLHIITVNSESEAKESIQRLIKKHRIENQVTFYPQQEQKNVVPFLQAADLLISPSRKEGFGLVVAEAISCGTPVVATKSGGPEDIITEKTGILVEKENPEALEKGISTISSKLDQYDSDILHQEMKEKFSTTAKRDKLMEVYRSVINH